MPLDDTQLMRTLAPRGAKHTYIGLCKGSEFRGFHAVNVLDDRGPFGFRYRVLHIALSAVNILQDSADKIVLLSGFRKKSAQQ
jgi:hypothetical protein